MAQHSKDKLADELLKAGLLDMSLKARSGYYHDFLSPLDFPCIQLANDLKAAGEPGKALLARHLNGDFDAPLAESEAWAESPEGKAAFDKLFKGK